MQALIGKLIAIVLAVIHVFGGSHVASDWQTGLSHLTGSAQTQLVSISTGPVDQAVVLAVDISQTMVGKPIQAEKDAAKQFVAQLSPKVPVAIVTFNGQAQTVQAYTTDHAKLNAILDGLQASGLRALYQGTLSAINLAASASAAQKVVVVLNDGWQYSARGTVSRGVLLEAASKARVTVYGIALGPSVDRGLLADLASQTHGLVWNAAASADLSGIYTKLAQRLSQAVTQTKGSPAPKLLTAATLTAATAVPAATIHRVMGPGRGLQQESVSYGPVVFNRGQLNGGRRDTNPTASFVIALDTSAAMVGTPLQRETDMARRLIDQLDGTTMVALLTYSGQSRTLHDFTVDKTALRTALNNLKANGPTALYDSSLAAVQFAATSSASNRSVVFFSGTPEGHPGSKASAQAAIDMAATDNIAVYTLPSGPQADVTYLTNLAQGTQANRLDAPTPADLTALYATLSGSLAQSPVSSTVNLTPLDSNFPPLVTDPPASDSTSTLNVAPVTVEVPGDTSTIQRAELSINGSVVASFDKAPYHYDLDLSHLSAGTYHLTFSTVNAQEVTSTGNLDFEIAVLAPSPSPHSPAIPPAKSSQVDPGKAVIGGPQVDQAEGINSSRHKPVSTTPLFQQDIPLTTGLTTDLAPRQVLVNGHPATLALTFSLDKGLILSDVAAAPPSSATGITPPETVFQILSRPTTLIPAPVRVALAAQHPRLWAIVIILMTLILLPQGLFTLFWMVYTWNNPQVADEYRSPSVFVAPQHSFSAILPARHEEAVLRDTIRAINAIDYPDDQKEILIMIRDDDDDATISAAQQTIDELGKNNIRLITFTDGPKNKPNGLNHGLRAASKEVVCVFDAEDQPHPDLYNVINTVMERDGADVVQSGVQLMNFTSTWFAALNCLEYFFWFKSGLHAFTRALKVTPLGGNTVFIKKHWLEKIGGWDDKCLTEDADIGIRLTAQGAKIQIVYDEQHVTQEETPATAASFIKQRTRWCQGFYEIFFKGDWLKLPLLKQKLTAAYILLTSLLQAAVVLFLPIGIYIGLTQRMPVPVAMVSWLPLFLLLTQLVINLVGIREFTAAYDKKLPFLFTVKLCLVYYPYQLMLAAASLRAVQRFLIRKNAWEKTTHANLHRPTQVAPQTS